MNEKETFESVWNDKSGDFYGNDIRGTLGQFCKIIWDHQQYKIDKINVEKNKLSEKLDGDIGYFYESMDFQKMAEYAARCDKKFHSLEKISKGYFIEMSKSLNYYTKSTSIEALKAINKIINLK